MEDASATSPSKTTKWLKLFVKIVITAACLWYVSQKIDFHQLSKTLWSANWFFLAAAVLLYMISKVAAAFRLNIYFKNINIHLSQFTNLKLYWLGLFYNLFLPGSISGDAYKVIYLTKKFKVSYKKTTAAVILDRLTGLLGLVFVLALYGFLVLNNNLYSIAILFAAILATILAYVVIKKWFSDFLPGFWSTFLLGLVVQLFSNSCAYMIMLSLGIEQDYNKYIFIFLVASIAAVLPLTLGGLGAREIVFLELSKYFGLIEHTSVLIGFLIYITVVISSAGGMIYIFIDPMRSSRKNELGLLRQRILNKGALWLSYIKLMPVLRKLNKDSIVIDCGANVGNITKKFAATGATVHAFEPDSIAFDILQKRFRSYPNVVLHNQGVWDKETTLDFFSHKDQEKEAAYTVSSSIISNKKNIDQEKSRQIHVIDLCAFISDLGRRVDLIKLDIEGAEIAVLKKMLEKETYKLFDEMYVETHEKKIPGHATEIAKIKEIMQQKNVRNIKLNWL